MQTAKLDDLLKLLLSKNIEFVLIGGFASVVYGASYVTQDLDICMALTDDSVDLLRSALKDLEPIHRMNLSSKLSFLDRPRPRPGEVVQNLYLQTNFGVLDIISSVTAAGDFESLRSRAITMHIYGYDCAVISLDDLIQSKEALGRRKDLLVVDELKEIP